MADRFRRLPGVRMASILLASLAILTACTWETSYSNMIAPGQSRAWNVRNISIVYADELRISEENSLAPDAEILWRGDPPGDRRQQVAAIFRAAAQRAVNGLNGSRPVRMNIEILRFHAVTQRTRESTAKGIGVHSITFRVQIVDFRSGQPITPVETIRADLPAFTGEEAKMAEARGQTQKVRITNHLTTVLRGWLGIGPDVRGTFERTGR